MILPETSKLNVRVGVSTERLSAAPGYAFYFSGLSRPDASLDGASACPPLGRSDPLLVLFEKRSL